MISFLAGRAIGMTPGMIVGSPMKTAISIDDGLLHEADETARRMGVSRSRLFALAVGDFMERQRREKMLAQLNEVYAAGMEPAEERVVKGIKRKVRRVVKQRW
jgi:predicted transcriptional regulator